MIKLFLLLFMCAVTAVAPAKSMKDFWITMPDSVVPYLSMAMRAELAECQGRNMRAEVKNRLEGTTVLDTLTDDYLSVRLSESSEMQIKRLRTDGDSVFCVIRTYQGPVADSQMSLYTADWTPIDAKHLFDGKCIKCVRRMLVARPDAMSQSQFDSLAQMVDPLLVKLTLSADSDELIVTADTQMLKNDDKKTVAPILMKIKYKWNGEVFKKI